MSGPYDRLIDAGAAALAKALRAAPFGSDVNVWAVFTTAEADGYLHAGVDYPDAPAGGFELIRPPQAFRNWSSVPYSAQRSNLWHACRRVPILPLERQVQP